MPYIPSKRKQQTKVITVDFEGEPVQVAYRPAAMTPRFVNLIQSVQTDIESIADIIQRVIVWWDVLDEEGNRLAPTPENTLEFDLTFLSAVVNAVVEDMSPGEATAVGSSGH